MLPFHPSFSVYPQRSVHLSSSERVAIIAATRSPRKLWSSPVDCRLLCFLRLPNISNAFLIRFLYSLQSLAPAALNLLNLPEKSGLALQRYH